MTRVPALSSAIVLACAGLTFSQQTAPSAATAKPAQFNLRVLEVKGRVFSGAANADPKLKDGWTQLKVGDTVGRGNQINTSLRSTVKLVLEPATPPTIILIDRASLVSIDELARGRDAEGLDAVVTRLGLAYGTVRAGVAEGDVRSDMVIQSPVATLAKRGTWGFSFYVERGTGHFEMYLAERGIVEAIQLASGLRMTIFPGQYVNQQMSRWIDTVRFSRPINIQDWKGLKGAELNFSLANQTGLGVISPGGGPIAILNLTGRQSEDFLKQFRLQVGNFSLQSLLTGGFSPFGGLNGNFGFGLFDFSNLYPRRLHYGNFGVGGGALPPFNPPFGTPGSKSIGKPTGRAHR